MTQRHMRATPRRLAPPVVLSLLLGSGIALASLPTTLPPTGGTPTTVPPDAVPDAEGLEPVPPAGTPTTTPAGDAGDTTPPVTIPEGPAGIMPEAPAVTLPSGTEGVPSR